MINKNKMTPLPKDYVCLLCQEYISGHRVDNHFNTKHYYFWKANLFHLELFVKKRIGVRQR
jgi:hypothetical protein